jgi:CHAD domain-containing protein
VHDVRTALKVLGDLQDTLGALNDLAAAGATLARCAATDSELGIAVALAGGWHGPRHEALRTKLPEHIAALRKLKRFWRN